MKKLTILTSVMALAAVSAMSQGYVNALNNSTTGLITVSSPSINGGAAVVVGTAANTAGFVGAGVGAVTVDVYVGAAGTSLANLELSTPYVVATSSTSTIGPAQGTITYPASGPETGGSPFVLPTGAAFNGTAAVEFLFFGFTASGYSGYSSLGTITPAVSGSGATAPPIFGTGNGQISSFNLQQPIPEPSTIILGGLGAAALLAFRRRK